jgi:hypothetical protein
MQPAPFKGRPKRSDLDSTDPQRPPFDSKTILTTRIPSISQFWKSSARNSLSRFETAGNFTKKRLLQSLPHAFELCLCTFDGSFRREVGLGRSSGSRDGWSYTRSTLARHLSSVRATSLRSWSLSVVKRGKCKERNHKNLFSEQMRWIHKNGCALGTLSCLGIHV